MSERKMVLLYNHADPYESFVSMLTDEEIQQSKKERGEFSEELYATAKKNRVNMPRICCYS